MLTPLLKVLTDNGPTAEVDFHGGDGTIFAVGTFDAGKVKLQASIDGAVWFDCTDTSGVVGEIAANGILNFQISPCKLRGSLSGATAPNVTIKIDQR